MSASYPSDLNPNPIVGSQPALLKYRTVHLHQQQTPSPVHFLPPVHHLSVTHHTYFFLVLILPLSVTSRPPQLSQIRGTPRCQFSSRRYCPLFKSKRFSSPGKSIVFVDCWCCQVRVGTILNGATLTTSFQTIVNHLPYWPSAGLPPLSKLDSRKSRRSTLSEAASLQSSQLNKCGLDIYIPRSCRYKVQKSLSNLDKSGST